MARGNLEEVTACSPVNESCTSFRYGHNIHTVISTFAGRTPHEWQTVVVEEVDGLVVTLTDVRTGASRLAWHHEPLPDLAKGDSVRVHPTQSLMEVSKRWVSVVLAADDT